MVVSNRDLREFYGGRKQVSNKENITHFIFYKMGKRILLLFNFSPRTPSVQLSEIHLPEEHNLRTTVGKCLLFYLGNTGDLGSIGVDQEKWKGHRWFFVCFRLLEGGLCTPFLCVCRGSVGWL